MARWRDRRYRGDRGGPGDGVPRSAVYQWRETPYRGVCYAMTGVGNWRFCETLPVTEFVGPCFRSEEGLLARMEETAARMSWAAV